MKVKIQFCEKNVALETGQTLESMEGELQIYKEDTGSTSQWLKSNGFVGIIDYADNSYSDLYSIQLHTPEQDFFRIVQLVSQGTQIELAKIDTPLHDPHLAYASHDSIAWKNKEQKWVGIEKFDLSFGAINSDTNERKVSEQSGFPSKPL